MQMEKISFQKASPQATPQLNNWLPKFTLAELSSLTKKTLNKRSRNSAQTFYSGKTKDELGAVEVKSPFATIKNSKSVRNTFYLEPPANNQVNKPQKHSGYLKKGAANIYTKQATVFARLRRNFYGQGPELASQTMHVKFDFVHKNSGRKCRPLCGLFKIKCCSCCSKLDNHNEQFEAELRRRGMWNTSLENGEVEQQEQLRRQIVKKMAIKFQQLINSVGGDYILEDAQQNIVEQKALQTIQKHKTHKKHESAPNIDSKAYLASINFNKNNQFKQNGQFNAVLNAHKTYYQAQYKNAGPKAQTNSYQTQKKQLKSSFQMNRMLQFKAKNYQKEQLLHKQSGLNKKQKIKTSKKMALRNQVKVISRNVVKQIRQFINKQNVSDKVKSALINWTEKIAVTFKNDAVQQLIEKEREKQIQQQKEQQKRIFYNASMDSKKRRNNRLYRASGYNLLDENGAPQIRINNPKGLLDLEQIADSNNHKKLKMVETNEQKLSTMTLPKRSKIFNSSNSKISSISNDLINSNPRLSLNNNKVSINQSDNLNPNSITTLQMLVNPNLLGVTDEQGQTLNLHERRSKIRSKNTNANDLPVQSWQGGEGKVQKNKKQNARAVNFNELELPEDFQTLCAEVRTRHKKIRRRRNGMIKLPADDDEQKNEYNRFREKVLMGKHIQMKAESIMKQLGYEKLLIEPSEPLMVQRKKQQHLKTIVQEIQNEEAKKILEMYIAMMRENRKLMKRNNQDTLDQQIAFDFTTLQELQKNWLEDFLKQNYQQLQTQNSKQNFRLIFYNLYSKGAFSDDNVAPAPEIEKADRSERLPGREFVLEQVHPNRRGSFNSILSYHFLASLAGPRMPNLHAPKPNNEVLLQQKAI